MDTLSQPLTGKSDNAKAAKARPLGLSSYYVTEMIRALDSGAYIGIGSPALSLSSQCQKALQEIIDYHRTFLDVGYDFQPKKSGSEFERKQFWKLMDDAEEMLRKELQPDKFVLVSVKAPDPNPFSE